MPVEGPKQVGQVFEVVDDVVDEVVHVMVGLPVTLFH